MIPRADLSQRSSPLNDLGSLCQGFAGHYGTKQVINLTFRTVVYGLGLRWTENLLPIT